MKRFLPLLLGLLHPCPKAQAQSPLVMSLFSAASARSKYGSSRMQDPQENSRPVFYEGAMFHCKRSMGSGQGQKASAAIIKLEEFLTQRYAVLLTDTAQILSPALEATYAARLQEVQAAARLWNTQAYDEEMAFYRHEDEVRQQWRQEVQAVRLRRAQRQARRDSAARWLSQAEATAPPAPAPPPK